MEHCENHKKGPRAVIDGSFPRLGIRNVKRHDGIQVYCTLTMAADDIPAGTTLQELLGAKRDAARWRAYFYEATFKDDGRKEDGDSSALSCADSFFTKQKGKSIFRVDNEAYVGGTLFDDAIQLATTPARPPKALRFELGGGEGDVLSEVLETLALPAPNLPEYLEDTVRMTPEWKTYHGNLKKYLSYLKESTEGHAKVYSDLDTTVKESLETIDQNLLKQTIALQYIQTQVGKSNTPQSDTLWMAVNSLREEVDYLLAKKGSL